MRYFLVLVALVVAAMPLAAMTASTPTLSVRVDGAGALCSVQCQH